MGERSGTEGAPPGRARALWLTVYANRTKVIGYAGVVTGSIYMAVQAGQHWQLVLLGALVAALGHYNDRVASGVGP